MAKFDRATLAKVLEILDSSHSGEALAAAKLAAAMVREAGLSWDQVIARDVQPQAIDSSHAPAGRPRGTGPFGYRRERELSPHEQLFMVLLSPRTPGRRAQAPRTINSTGTPACDARYKA